MNGLFLILDNDVTKWGQEGGFCTQSADIWQVVGYVLLVFKIVIPVILIVLGMIDLGKAVVASKDDEIKKSMKSLMMRAIAAIAIFFVPTIISMMMGVASRFGDVKKDFDACKDCISSPTGDKCKGHVNKASN